MRNLLSTRDLDVAEVELVLRLAERMSQILHRGESDTLLAGKVVCSLFFEDSTRTRLSFERAARCLGAEVMTFAPSNSSLNKGESLRDTVETLTAMGADVFVVRHRSSGVPTRVSTWTDAGIINAGDGSHQHPTQALLDVRTLAKEWGCGVDFTGRHLAIVGDVRHSRVARSNVDLFSRMGARVTLVAPEELQGQFSEDATTVTELDEVIGEVDALYLLRIQHERIGPRAVPSLAEYRRRFALTRDRVARMKPDAVILHPGPINRGSEVLVDVTRLECSRILDQVANGVPIRMAVLALVSGATGSFAGAAPEGRRT